MAGIDIGRPCIGGNGRLHLTVSAMDDNKITSNGRSMDGVMEFGKEVASNTGEDCDRRQQQRRRGIDSGQLHLTAVVDGGQQR